MKETVEPKMPRALFLSDITAHHCSGHPAAPVLSQVHGAEQPRKQPLTGETTPTQRKLREEILLEGTLFVRCYQCWCLESLRSVGRCVRACAFACVWVCVGFPLFRVKFPSLYSPQSSLGFLNQTSIPVPPPHTTDASSLPKTVSQKGWIQLVKQIQTHSSEKKQMAGPLGSRCRM